MLFQRALKGVGEVKKKEGGEEERKEWEGRRAEGRGNMCHWLQGGWTPPFRNTD